MSFKQIKGQEQAVSFLVNSFKNKRLANAYLFVGPQGVGKSFVAQNFAKMLNCQSPELGICDQCISCQKIDKFSHPDIHWIEKDDTGFTSIDKIRELEKDIYLRPYEANKKIFVIVEAEAMTEEASNALLKTLEEPPLDSIIILTTAYPERLFSTIVSRCQKIFFPVMGTERMKNILIDDYNLDSDKSHFIANFSEGRFGRAMRFKDEDILREKNRIINSFIYQSDSGRFPLDIQDKFQLKNAFQILINWFRDILLFKIGYDSLKIINIDRKQDLSRMKNRYSLDELQEIIYTINDISSLIDRNINRKIALSIVRSKTWKS